MMKKMMAMLLCLLLAAGCAGAEEDAYRQFLTLDTCGHIWEPAAAEDTEEGRNVPVTRTAFVDTGMAHMKVTYSMMRCTLCGVCQEMPKGTELPHAYTVEEWKAEGDLVRVTYRCEDCLHCRKETLTISSLAAEGADCMHGGACPQAGLYTDDQAGALKLADGRAMWLTRVQVETETGLVWQVARRLRCPFCRRPALQHQEKLDADEALCAGLPEQTLAEFLLDQTETLLPYQLIDRLLADKAAPGEE